MAVKKKAKFPLIKIKLRKSLIGRTQKQRAIVRGLGLGKVDSEVIREKRPEILGMIKKIDFMLEVTDVTDVSVSASREVQK
jgi:large subunit ribosomal protein L30